MAKFQKGKSGNPAGRPRGIRDRRSRLRELLGEAAPRAIDVVVKAASQGDIAACKLILERVIPRLRPVDPTVVIPEWPDDMAARAEVVLVAMSQGQLSPGTAGAILGALVREGDIQELSGLISRLERLEAAVGRQE